jgi:hypothetical protein
MHGFLGFSTAATLITEYLLVLNDLMMQLSVLKIGPRVRAAQDVDYSYSVKYMYTVLKI